MDGISFKVNYVPTLPLEGNNPKVSLFGQSDEKFFVQFFDKRNNKLLYSGTCGINQIISGQRQWFTEWEVKIYNQKGDLLFLDEYNPKSKTVFIKLDAYALGDNIAWIPYAEEFRKKHDCTVICSTFWNELFESEYPEILFVEPNTRIGNVYSQIYIGANESNNIKYSPIKSIDNPLQKVATEILGLEYKEIKSQINSRFANRESQIVNHGGKYVTLSEFGSTPKKSWGNSWQPVVNYLNDNGYQVVVISKESTNLKNIIDKTGNIPIGERIIDITNASFHLGISSGLSWLAWGLGVHVVMVSDCTPHYHEFQSNISRIGTNIDGVVNYEEISVTPTEIVIEKIGRLLGI